MRSMRLVALAVAAAALLLPGHAHATLIHVNHRHLVLREVTAAAVVTSRCQVEPLQTERLVLHCTSRSVLRPHPVVHVAPRPVQPARPAPRPAPRPVQRTAPTPPSNSYAESMLVTYYTDTGYMADGVWTFFGAAACGYDLALGTRVSVPGVGLLTCHDRIGFQPYRHIDVWGYRAGLGSDYRLVTVYP